MDIDSLRNYCLSFPHATEDIQWGNDLLFRVSGKIFAVMSLDPPHSFAFKCSPEKFDELIEIEDAIEASFGEVAEVTGGGSGQKGSNVDLRVDDKVPVEKVLDLVRSSLTSLGVRSARIVINGKEWPLDPDSRAS